MKRILIVEDDKDMQEIYRDIFKGEEAKYSIDIEGDAEQALQRIEKEAFDLVILDIIMEPMSGDSFLVHLRNRPKTKKVPVIVVSILKDQTLAALKQLGNVYFFQKPITKEKILAKVAALTA